ncbi:MULTISPECIES: ABC transporter permease [unclassified Pseudonocardia]|jgi:ABC-type transport system involved in multi-copper enzyme maturation permease subunit|uniref:ABC transporter permease n=1 Tax=unclassified Pseudonocardia TaxID=2619320 RepID=UPI001AC2B138|nr:MULTISPECIES: ABC transporter permease [unclassified Pseudonocardia]MBN9097294.1 ABC transporter permease [Pseudonocardia sp.]
MTGLVRAEFRKAFSTKLWWALLVPVVVLSLLVNLFGGLFTASLADAHAGTGVPPILLGSLAYSLSLTSVFAALYGVVTAAAEFRHRTITTAYLTAQGRGRVFTAKAVSTGAVGALYAAATVVVGVLAGLVAHSGLPGVGALAAVTAVGLLVAALWAVLGTALGTVISNQATALVVTLVYMLVAETLLSLLLGRSDNPVAAGLAAYLPVNAGDVAVYDVAGRALLGDGTQLAELLAGVSRPPPWWGALLVLAAWTAAAAATAWLVGRRRDIT